MYSLVPGVAAVSSVAKMSMLLVFVGPVCSRRELPHSAPTIAATTPV